jgi:hypothetical protein
MTDLDRPYVINGDDLRILLAVQHRFRIGATFDHGEALGQIVNPARTAADWLAKNGRLDEMPQPDGTRVTVGQLADALKGKHAFRVPRWGTDGIEHFGYLNYPEALAESLLEDITGKAHAMPQPGDVVDATIADDEPDEPPTPAEYYGVHPDLIAVQRIREALADAENDPGSQASAAEVLAFVAATHGFTLAPKRA